MKIVLATGIYPPAIGGPATYTASLARELTLLGHAVTVVTYGNEERATRSEEQWKVISVPLGFPILRWFTYAAALRKTAHNADIVYAFSSVSCGVPLWLSGVKKPKRILRLGGDFLWERYTDRGGMKSLREWYEDKHWSSTVAHRLLNTFDHIVFSTEFQRDIYAGYYRKLPAHSVIENAMEVSDDRKTESNQRPHTPFRLLFMGRFVAFKNLFTLIDALREMPDCVLTLVGEGPLDDSLRDCVERNDLHHRVRFVGPVHGQEKEDIFASHDLFVLPSLTEISPNVALEAAASRLPVLLTDEHGLSEALLVSIDVAPLSTVAEIRTAVRDAREHRHEAPRISVARTWKTVASEHERLFKGLCVVSPQNA